MRRMIPQKLIDAIKHLAQSESEILSLAEKSTELLAIENSMSISGGILTIDEDSVVDGDLGVNYELNVTGDASVGGDVEVTGSIKSGENSVFDITSATISVPTGLTSEWIYGKFIEKDQLVYLVVMFKVSNPTESSVALANSVIINIDIPENIGEKIYDMQGTLLSENGNDNCTINISPAYRVPSPTNPTSAEQSGFLVFARRNSNAGRTKLLVRSGPTLSAGSDFYIISRTFLVE